jgi:hypothetical protein
MWEDQFRAHVRPRNRVVWTGVLEERLNPSRVLLINSQVVRFG